MASAERKGRGEKFFESVKCKSRVCNTRGRGWVFSLFLLRFVLMNNVSTSPPPLLSAPAKQANLPLVISNSHSPEQFLVFPANSRWQESTAMFLKNSKCGQFICVRKTLICVIIFAKKNFSIAMAITGIYDWQRKFCQQVVSSVGRVCQTAKWDLQFQIPIQPHSQTFPRTKAVVKHQRRGLLEESGGMLTQKISKSRSSEMPC